MKADIPLVLMPIFVQGTVEFTARLATLERRGVADLSAVEQAVASILRDVLTRGDQAVRDACERFEGRIPSPLVRPLGEEGHAALARLPMDAQAALQLAADRIRRFHEHQRDSSLGSFGYDEGGTHLGTRVRPVRRAGVYAPGGKARYPSSVLMAAIPAAVAGVREIVLATPLSGDGADDAVLAAAALSGVTQVLDAGGAQAIGALAYGTESLRKVDVIVGPGNIYVACAKRLVSGHVRIDGIAGPSEILVLADDSADPRVIAADLLSQAEHDEAAYPLLVTTSEVLAQATALEVSKQLAVLPRQSIATESIRGQGAIFVVQTRDDLQDLANVIAAEHLALHVDLPEALLDGIDAAGAAFIGASTPEAAGDYLAGPSHVLPTGGAVRFGSPLGVYDFLTRTSIVRYDAVTLRDQSAAICTLARLEGLEGHARAVEVRLNRE